MMLDPERVDLGELVDDVADCLRVLAEERDQTLIIGSAVLDIGYSSMIPGTYH